MTENMDTYSQSNINKTTEALNEDNLALQGFIMVDIDVPEFAEIKIHDTNEENVSIDEKVKYTRPTTMGEKDKIIEIQRLYPSIVRCLSSIEVETDKREAIDVVTEMVTKPEAPVEDWQLPAAMPEAEMMRYYDNTMLDNIKETEAQFMKEMGQQMHPLMDLVQRWERSVSKVWRMKERMKVEREICAIKSKELWRVTEKSGVKDGRCKDNLVVHKSYVYSEAVYEVEGGEQLEQGLRRVGGEVMEELCLAQYETGVNKALVESCLVQVRSSSAAGMFTEVRQCIAVLLLVFRRPLAHVSCKKVLQDWVVYLGSAIAENGSSNDRLYILWQLLHAPAGVAEWGAALVQSSRTDREMDLAVTYLAMIIASPKHREHLLQAYNPGSNPEEQEELNVTSNWSLLRESDLKAFLAQVPIEAIFKNALDIDPHREAEVMYDPGFHCRPTSLLRVMAFCHRFIGILDRGLDQGDLAGYTIFARKISRLITHAVQFLTDHLELVLGTSMAPAFHEYFPSDTRLVLLAQYETVFEAALISLLVHHSHGNWQCLADLPWRMLSPNRKESILYRIVDPKLSTPTTIIDQLVSSLHSTIECAQQSEGIYLLTALSNLALECRVAISTEYKLISTITNILFQTCYGRPVTRSLFSKVGRELLSSVCLQHPQALSFILEAVKLWHPLVGQMGLFLFRELPFCLMIPTEVEFKLLSSWLLDNAPISVCNQLARHVFSNLNWGFANADETFLYLPLSLHQRMADLIVQGYKKHTIDSKSGQWLLENMKMVTSLWWNQKSLEEQSFHTWCLRLAIRLRLHPTTRPRVFDQNCLTVAIYSSEWVQSLSDAQQDKCTNPVAMYMAVVTRFDTKIPELTSLKILQSLISRRQQYRLSMELISSILLTSTPTELNYLVGNDTFMALWLQIIQVDVVKNTSKQFPGPVLSCLGISFSSSLVIGNGDLGRQEIMMRFFLRSILGQANWMSEHCSLWLLDKLLEIDTALDLKAGLAEVYDTTKIFFDNQFMNVSTRWKANSLFRIPNFINTLLSKVADGDYFWVKSYIVEAQALLEDDMKIWPTFLKEIFVGVNKRGWTVNKALEDVCRHLKLSLWFSKSKISIFQAAWVLSTCPPENYAAIRLSLVFFKRYLGIASIWDESLRAYGSAGHLIFLDDSCIHIIQELKAGFGAIKTFLSTEVEAFLQNEERNEERLAELLKLRDIFETFHFWIDEARLHFSDYSISELPEQYRADLLEGLRRGQINFEDFISKKSMLQKIEKGASLWTARHDLDLSFVRLAEIALRKVPAPIATRLFQRFNRQTTLEELDDGSLSLYVTPTISDHAMLVSTHMLEFISGFLASMYQCAVKFKTNQNFMMDIDKMFVNALTRYYEPSLVSQTCDDCGTTIKYLTWVAREEVVQEVASNREEYNRLVEEILDFDSLDEIVNAMACLDNLIKSLGSQLQQCTNDDERKKFIDYGMTLFFHIGHQVNQETQSYPPHRRMVSSCMEFLGAVFVPYASKQAHKLLQGMLENELLVEIYGPHFNPNMDDTNSALMYSQIVSAHRDAKCPPEVSFVILSKFNMRQFMEHSPLLASRICMLSSLCDAIGALRLGDVRDAKIEIIHVENLVVLLSDNFSKCLSTVLERFRALCQESRLGPHFWTLVVRCANEDIKEHGELSLTIEEIKKELEGLGTWLNGIRFSDAVCKKDGLFIKYGKQAAFVTELCGLLLDSLLFKMCRSATENIVSWHEVITSGWDLLLKLYIPWLQAFPASEGPSGGSICYPWRVQDKQLADRVAQLVVQQLNVFVSKTPNEESRGFLLHCVLIWIVNGLLVHKQLPSEPYHDSYCPAMKQLRWDVLQPSSDCIKLILEFFSRSYNSEQSMALLIDVASKVRWSKVTQTKGSVFQGLLFEMVVTMVCKSRSVFKEEAMEHLTEGLAEVHWNELAVADYRKGMTQLAAHLEPRIILSNPSTIEGKVIKLLNQAVGEVGVTGLGLVSVSEKQAIYISTVVKLLSVAFSFTQTKNSKGKSTTDECQLKMFLLRVSGLLTEMETVVNQVKDASARHNLALTLLAEVLELFKNHSIAAHALEPVLGWIQESRNSALILPFLNAIFRWPPHVPSMVRLSQELIEAYLLSDNSDGGPASWATMTACARLGPELEQQFLRESVRNSCVLCLVQQTLLALPSVNDVNTESWQNRIVEWLDETRPHGAVLEQGAVLLVFLYLQLFLSAASTNPRPSRSFDSMIQLLLKLSQSKKSSGLLGMVGMGKRSSFSFQFRVMCRSVMVFLQAQLPSNNLLRTMPNQPGGLIGQNVTITSRLPGEPLPTNKTLQNLDWLKSQRQSKELAASMKPVLEMSITYICDPTHCVMDSIAFVRLLCQELWPREKLLGLVHSSPA